MQGATLGTRKIYVGTAALGCAGEKLMWGRTHSSVRRAQLDRVLVGSGTLRVSRGLRHWHSGLQLFTMSPDAPRDFG